MFISMHEGCRKDVEENFRLSEDSFITIMFFLLLWIRILLCIA
jgi:hypothetical protein